MTHSLYAVVPVTKGLWSKESKLSADCLNDLHSFDKQLLENHGFRPYQYNTLRLRTTSDVQLSVDCKGETASFNVVLVELDFFRQRDYCMCVEHDYVVLMHLTAEKLLEIALEVHRIASK